MLSVTPTEEEQMKTIRIQITDQERQRLLELRQKSGDYRSERALAVLHCADGRRPRQIADMLKRSSQAVCQYVFVDGVYLKRSWGGEVQNVSVLVAVGVNDEGYREILGVAEGSREDKESWSNFLRYLKERGLKGVRLIVSDKCLGLYEIIGDFFPEAKWQRCIVHWYRNAFTMCPRKHLHDVVAMLKAIHAQEDKEAARQKVALVVRKLQVMKLERIVNFIKNSVEETLTYMDFSYEHWSRLRTNNGLERIMKEIRRRTRVVGSFPDGYSAMMLVGARLRHISTTKWDTRQYMTTCKLYEGDVR